MTKYLANLSLPSLRGDWFLFHRLRDTPMTF